MSHVYHGQSMRWLLYFWLLTLLFSAAVPPARLARTLTPDQVERAKNSPRLRNARPVFDHPQTNSAAVIRDGRKKDKR